MSRNLFWLIPAIFSIILSGCEINTCDTEEDLEPPAEPRGVYSITGDGEVIIKWFPNGESDLYKYAIWRSRDNEEFDFLDEVLYSGKTQYIDRDVINGETYYYAVSAIDYDGNESDLSPETVSDTPRPEDYGVTLRDYNLWPDRSGWDFSNPRVIPWDDPKTDIYFGFDEEVWASYMYSDYETMEMQDMGYHEDMSDVDESPVRGFTTLFVELIEGHVYTFYTPDRHYAMIRVLTVTSDTVTFDWAHQIDRDNPELAPALLKYVRSEF